MSNFIFVPPLSSVLSVGNSANRLGAITHLQGPSDQPFKLSGVGMQVVPTGNFYIEPALGSAATYTGVYGKPSGGGQAAGYLDMSAGNGSAGFSGEWVYIYAGNSAGAVGTGSGNIQLVGGIDPTTNTVSADDRREQGSVEAIGGDCSAAGIYGGDVTIWGGYHHVDSAFYGRVNIGTHNTSKVIIGDGTVDNASTSSVDIQCDRGTINIGKDFATTVPTINIGTGWRVTTSSNLEKQAAGVYILSERSVAAKTDAVSPYSVTVAESRRAFTTEGAVAEVNFLLPSAAAGLEYEFAGQAAQNLRITAAGGDTIRMYNLVSAAAGNILAPAASAQGSTVKLLCINATEWIAMNWVGPWTVT